MISTRILRGLFKYMGDNSVTPFKVTFINGSVYESKTGKEPAFHFIFKTSRAQWATIFFSEIGLSRNYFLQNIDIEGDIIQMTVMRGEILKQTTKRSNPLLRLLNRWHEFQHGNHSLRHAKDNANHHYGRGTEMFRQYLDPTMTYTCAYWKEGTKNLEEAQWNKLDHVCKKLRLQPGETLVDVGSGWGSLLFHAYENYGVLGTNVSPTIDQNRAMAEEIRKRGVGGKIKIQEADFRETKGVFDKYVSLGVYEHAGYHQLEDWIKSMAESTKEGGIGLLHFIGHIRRDFNETGYFIRNFIFPGGYLPGLAETIEIMDKYDLEILDVENLRRHYAPTLRAWGENFDKNWEKIHALDPKKYDEYFRRMWRFYLYACSGSFLAEGSHVGLFQIVFSKGRTKTYPMSRTFLYEDNIRSRQKTEQKIQIEKENIATVAV